ncbi:MAG: hypothetical protein QM778_00700 [Myxococcales bacterium]
MAILLVHMHGKRDASLSNQMRQAKSMAPDYAVRWWKERHMRPPDVDPVSFLLKRVAWRYARGVPALAPSQVILGDSTQALDEIRERIRARGLRRATLLFTSPPYCGITNYHYDQWLRLWMLGGAPSARRPPGAGEYRDKFENVDKYRTLLRTVFCSAAESVKKSGTVYLRTGRQEETLSATLDALREAFPKKRVRMTRRPFLRPTQTKLFGDKSQKQGEVDLVIGL